MAHANNLVNMSLKYLGDLQLNDLCQLRDELDTAWSQGQAKVSNQVYDKVADGINYEVALLKNDVYAYGVKRTDQQLKNLLDYLTVLHGKHRPLVDNTVWDILNQELAVRNVMKGNIAIQYPSHWTGMSLDDNPVEFITLSHSSAEFQEIGRFLSSSLPRPEKTAIYSIIRIQNLRLWLIFQELRKTIPNNSQRLFHGTASSTHQKLIMYHGFSRSFCPGGAIGDGVYFAVRAAYSDQNPYVMKKTNHRRELFICQVLTGNPSQGAWGLKSPAPGCHSLFNNSGVSNDMFCIFNAYQAYPEYIVQYDYE